MHLTLCMKFLERRSIAGIETAIINSTCRYSCLTGNEVRSFIERKFPILSYVTVGRYKIKMYTQYIHDWAKPVCSDNIYLK